MISFAQARPFAWAARFTEARGAALPHVTAWLAAWMVVLYLAAVARGAAPGWAALFCAVALLAASVAVAALVAPRPSLAVAPLVVAFAAMNLLFVLPYPDRLYGYDANLNLAATRLVDTHGWPLPEAATDFDVIHIVADYPSLDLLALALAPLTGAPLLQVARVLPAVLSVLSLIAFHVLLAGVLRERARVLATLGFAFLPMNIAFHSWYVRESLGFLLFVVTLLLVLRLALFRSIDRRLWPLAALLGAALVLAHHLSSLFLGLVLLGVGAHFVLTARFLAVAPEEKVARKRLAARLFLLGGASLAALALFWRAMSPVIFQNGVSFLQTLLDVSYARQETPASIRDASVREVVSLVFAALVSLALFALSITRARRAASQRALALSGLAVTAGFLVVFSRLTLYTKTLYVNPFRALTFAWTLLLIGAAGAPRDGTRHGLAPVAVMVVLFALVQMYSIPPDRYDPASDPYYGTGINRYHSTPGENAAYLWLARHDDGRPIYGDFMVVDFLGGMLQRRVVLEPALFTAEPPPGTEGIFVLRAENRDIVPAFSLTRPIPPVSPQAEARMESSAAYVGRLYDSADVRVYALGAPP